MILANDPDADRLGIAIRTSSSSFRILTGDEIGAILAVYLMRTDTGPSPKAFLASAVSSSMLEAVAKKEGMRFGKALTGFKWIGNETERMERGGVRVLFAYEEAIGTRKK